MASATNKRFNFYRRYLWNEDDFAALQTAFYSFVKGAFEGMFGGAVLTGHGYVAVSGFSIGVAAGISVDLNGELLVTTGQTNVLATTPGSGHTKKCLVVARSVVTDDTPMNKPTSPFSSVYLDELYGCSIVLIQGTVDGASFPAKVAGDVILFGVNLNDTGVASIDYTQRETGRPRKRQIRQVSSADATIAATDEIIEMTTGNTDRAATLPAANTVPGQSFTIVKVDSGTGVVNVSTASGQTQVLDSQYGSVRVYSNGTVYYVA
jgi:hypothetical protein